MLKLMEHFISGRLVPVDIGFREGGNVDLKRPNRGRFQHDIMALPYADAVYVLECKSDPVLQLVDQWVPSCFDRSIAGVVKGATLESEALFECELLFFVSNFWLSILWFPSLWTRCWC